MVSLTRCKHAAEPQKGQTMTRARLTLFAAAIASLGMLTAMPRQASALNLDFLNHMNPQYTACINNVNSALAPQYRNDQKLHDRVIEACNRAHPAFGQG